MSSSHSSASPQVKFVLEWSGGFEKRDLDIIAKPLHKDLRYIIYPRSLGRPEQNKEEFLGYFTKVIPLWTNNEITIHSVTEAPGKVISHFTAKTKTKIGMDLTYEAITIAHVVTDEDGSLKIKKLEEFVDSNTLIDIIKAYEAAGVGK